VQSDDLFSSRRPKQSNSSTASEAQAIQKSLIRTQNLLKMELQRVSHLGNAIEEDGKLLQNTMDDHKSLNTRNAHKALSALERAQRQEQRVLMVSVSFFFLAAFYVMWSRVLIKFDFVSILWSRL
jgi:Sec20